MRALRLLGTKPAIRSAPRRWPTWWRSGTHDRSVPAPRTEPGAVRDCTAATWEATRRRFQLNPMGCYSGHRLVRGFCAGSRQGKRSRRRKGATAHPCPQGQALARPFRFSGPALKLRGIVWGKKYQLGRARLPAALTPSDNMARQEDGHLEHCTATVREDGNVACTYRFSNRERDGQALVDHEDFTDWDDDALRFQVAVEVGISEHDQNKIKVVR